MPKNDRRAPGMRPAGSSQTPGRPSLTPANPLSGRTALLQAMILLGLPLALLFAAKLILRRFFPSLGY